MKTKVVQFEEQAITKMVLIATVSGIWFGAFSVVLMANGLGWWK